jgi:hypothetical protein
MKKILITIIFPLSLVILSTLTANALVMSYADLWDVSQGTSVTGSSGALTGAWSSDPRNMFGGTYGSGPGDVTNNTIFKDYQAAGYLHWIEWATSAPITLGSFNLVASHDAGWDGNENRNINFRGFSTFRLFYYNGSSWTQIYSYATDPDSDLDYGGGVNYTAQNMLELFVNITPITAQNFRAEFVQYGNGSRYYGDSQGPRINELDGYAYVPPSGVPEPSTMLLLGSGLIGLAGYGRKRFLKK